MAPNRSSRRKKNLDDHHQQQPAAAGCPDPDPQELTVVARQRHQLPGRDQLPEDYSDVIDSNGVITTEVLDPYLAGRVPPPREIVMSHRHREYLQMIVSSYKPLHPQLYNMDNPEAFFVPSFLKAIQSNSIQSFADIIHQPLPGVYAFSMLQPSFCEMFIDEVTNILVWAHPHVHKKWIAKPTTIDKIGVAISGLGMQGMLDDLLHNFISPISEVLFPEVGGGSLDTQYSFIVSYSGDDSDNDSGRGLHVDESEITLNVCLHKQCSGGDISFHGRRCTDHINSHVNGEEVYRYSEQVPGQALMYHGLHRRRVLPTHSGCRVSMFMWCRSSAYKEKIKPMNHFPDWCAKCQS